MAWLWYRSVFMKLAVRMVAVLYLVAAALMLLAIGAVVYGFGQEAAEAGRSDSLPLGVLFTSAAMVLLCSYAGAGWCLLRRTRWRAALIFSAVGLLGFPVGTVLGVAALVLLSRPSIRAEFGAACWAKPKW